ncbi:c-type cytochrome [Fulvivirga sp. M361]|uniref:c-type cytochrome n=1 Tax=Fulvivirga sp. M361 TaxID=2594266 RepID=UPI001C86FA59|nr:c-type cytochrome [Fulvivirga sp. M361]
MSVFIMACNGNESTQSSNQDLKAETDRMPVKKAIPDSEEEVSELPEGLKLINGSDCNVCHKKDIKLVGPSYIDIANKYDKSDKVITTLAETIIKGGKGVWGEVMMTAHPSLKGEDVEKMVEYILDLRTIE